MGLDSDLRFNGPGEPGNPALEAFSSPEAGWPEPLPRPVALRGKMTANGYQPENWQWLDVTEPNPKRTDSTGRPRRMGRDPMTIPVEVLRASGHGPREARRVIGALGDEPIDPTIRRLTELRRYCLSCAENAAEVRRCAIIDCPLWPYRMGRNPHNPQRGVNPFA